MNFISVVEVVSDNNIFVKGDRLLIIRKMVTPEGDIILTTINNLLIKESRCTYLISESDLRQMIFNYGSLDFINLLVSLKGTMND